MDKNSTSIKKKIAMAAVLVGAVLSILTFLFIHEVKEELWKQSVQTIIESTQQGCNTLKVQLMDDYQSMGTVTLNLREFASGQREELYGGLRNLFPEDLRFQGMLLNLEETGEERSMYSLRLSN